MVDLNALLSDPQALNKLLVQSQELLLYTLLIALAFAVLCGVIAARWQLRWVYWSVMGFAFGPFALPFLFRAKPKQTKSAT